MRKQRYSNLNWSRRTGVGLGAVALGLTALLLPSCASDNPNEEIGQGTTTTEDVAEVGSDSTATSELVGQDVTLRNVIGETVGESSFTIEDSGEPILVVNATGVPFVAPTEDIPVQVTGTVESFAISEVEREYGLDLDPNLYSEYEQQPVVIAQSLALAPTPEDLFESPTNYIDQQIAVEGDIRKMEETSNAFALYEEGWVDDVGVLIIDPTNTLQNREAEEWENVTVTGVARQADAALLQQANLGWDDAKIQEFLSRYTDRPVIVADGVYPSAVDPAPGN